MTQSPTSISYQLEPCLAGDEFILLAAPKAESYYPHIGMTRHSSCWIIPRQESPREA